MINVTKAFLPPLDEYKKYIDEIWKRGHLTNSGPLVNELEERLRNYFGVKHFYFVSNGTIALQIAIKALDLSNEIITTPFSYVATTSSIVWENAKPVFVDIDPKSLTIDPSKIESAITQNTTAIIATHVYGVPCNVVAIDSIAKKFNLKVVYDAAHAFGVNYNGASLITYGDISTLSFHATKLFHTIEGGGIATNDDALAHRISYMRNFGHKGQEEFWGVGINGKNSEFHAAMGLCNLPLVEKIIKNREKMSILYDNTFASLNIELSKPQIPLNTQYNYSYYPVFFQSEEQLLSVKNALNKEHIFPRRYFYPSLDVLPYVSKSLDVDISNSIAKRALCLPLYYDIPEDSIENICSIIAKTLTI